VNGFGNEVVITLAAGTGEMMGSDGKRWQTRFGQKAVLDPSV
jgi:hypothetical protein